MLPHVLRFNYPVNAQRQAWVSDALGRPGEDAAEVVGDLIAELDCRARCVRWGSSRTSWTASPSTRCWIVLSIATPGK